MTTITRKGRFVKQVICALPACVRAVIVGRMTHKNHANARILTYFNLGWTTDWTAIFGVERPLLVEIGFGNGAFLAELAARHPDHNVIGLEISSKSLEKAQNKLIARGLANACVVYSAGEVALHHLLEQESVQAFYINYPDPWFKTRHAKRRLMQRDTLDALVSRLVVGGKLHLATDIVEYAEMSHELLANTPALTNLLGEAWSNHDPNRLLTTKYEAKGLREGRVGNYFLYERNASPAPDVPVLRELYMPHVILETPDTPEELVTRFQRVAFNPAPDIHVAIRDAYISRSRRAVLYEAHVEEPTIEQHIAIMLMPREEANCYTLKYTTLGHPRVTMGLHYATEQLGEWIVSLNPNARIIAMRTLSPDDDGDED